MNHQYRKDVSFERRNTLFSKIQVQNKATLGPPKMASSPIGCCAVQWAMLKGGGALPPVTGLTVQRIICC